MKFEISLALPLLTSAVSIPQLAFGADWFVQDIVTNRPFNFSANIEFPFHAVKSKQHDYFFNQREGTDEIILIVTLIDEHNNIQRHFNGTRFYAENMRFEVPNVIFPSYILPKGVDSKRFKFQLTYYNRDCGSPNVMTCILPITLLKDYFRVGMSAISPSFNIVRATKDQILVDDWVFLKHGDKENYSLTIYDTGKDHYNAAVYSSYRDSELAIFDFIETSLIRKFRISKFEVHNGSVSQ
jgi:hypothetical protein